MEKELKEPPLWLSSLTRLKNKENLGNRKGDILICGLDSSQPWCKETKCEYCRRVCYYTPAHLDLVKKNAKKICPFCAFEKHNKDIPENARDILKRVIEISKDKGS